MAMSQQLAPMLGTRSEVRSRRGAVSSGHPTAVAAGLRALARGGNAIDATVAAAFTAFVAEPYNAGVGGYGHVSAYLAGAKRYLTVDHGPRAPQAAGADMFELDGSGHPEGHDWPRVVGERNATGHLAIATPGAVAGLWALHQRAGRLRWSELLEPAIALADDGLEVTWTAVLRIAARLDEIRAYPALASVLLPNGRLPRSRSTDSAGERLNQTELATTLRKIAQDGPDAFYRGPVGEQIGAAVAEGGGVLSADDLAAYEPKIIDERPHRYREFEYVTANDSVGYETLGILDHFPLADLKAASAEHLHLLAEAMGHAFADNVTYSRDPDFTDDPVEQLSASEFAAGRARAIRTDRAAPRPILPIAPWQLGTDAAMPVPSIGGARGTTQVVAADAGGNLVSLITTIGGSFGSLVAVPGTGIILNNSMVNYDPRPGRANSIAPGKMPFFAVPAIVATREEEAAFAAAGSGGYPILAGVINTLVNHIDHGLPIQAAIDQPRVHSQGHRTHVEERVPAETVDRLRALGHEVVVKPVTPGEMPFGRVSAIAIRDGEISAGGGPSWSTAVGGL